MGTSTPCPDPVHLRLVLLRQARGHEWDSVRAHLERCDACRAIVMKLGIESESGTGDLDQKTLAFENLEPARPAMAAAGATQPLRARGSDAGNAVRGQTLHSA